MTKYYPVEQVSRSLTPDGRAFGTIVARHDKRITDADLNLMQELQDEKRKSYFGTNLFSGCIEYAPFQFKVTDEGRFIIPQFRAMLNGRVITVGGQGSASKTDNLVVLPQRSRDNAYWTDQMNPDNEAAVYVVYLEFWERFLDVETGTGYWVDPLDNSRWVYPNGCVGALQANLLADDVVDPFEGLHTTSRTQTQWAIRAQRLPLKYDFTLSPSGLDKQTAAGFCVYGRGHQDQIVKVPGYEFTSMGPVNGDYGLWRSGVEGNLSALDTIDGFTYAIPMALVFQRNTGVYDVSLNPFGCASPTSRQSGMLRDTTSGRPDNRYADVVYPEDVVDTRNVTYINPEDPDVTINKGFVDLISGVTQLKPGRGDGTGCKDTALGSQLPYTVWIGPDSPKNVSRLGKFDGFMSGFSSDERLQFVTKMFTVNDKVSGTKGQRWATGDAVKIGLDLDTANPARSKAYIKSAAVQVVTSTSDGSKQPALLYIGQVTIDGVGSREVTVRIAENLPNSAFDPVSGPIFITVGVVYPAGGGMDLRVIPTSVAGGQMFDATTGSTLPVFGVSDYSISKTILATSRLSLDTINPGYSPTQFGTFYSVLVDASSGVRKEGTTPSWVFTLPRKGIMSKYTGVSVASVEERLPGDNRKELTIINRTITPDSLMVEVNADYSSRRADIWISIQLTNTVQIGYNAPVKGVVAMEETTIVGQGVPHSYGLPSDSRTPVLDVTYLANKNSVVIGANGCSIKGVAGLKGVKFIYVSNAAGTGFTAYPVEEAVVFNGLVTVTVPNDVVNLTNRAWFLIMAISPAPAPSSSFTLTSNYIPYQGEGIEDREYQILYSEDSALITTNGTGVAPVPGIRDVYPFNRELPVSVSLPSQVSWKDTDLLNHSLNVQFDSNYEAKRQSNIEHTIKVPLHTNDFIEPLTGWKRKSVILRVKAGRGFANSFPHTGFAIKKPQARSVLGDSVLATAAPITLYVSNTVGKDTSDGLFRTSPKRSIQGALSVLPPVLRHPVTIYLLDTSEPYLMSKMVSEGTLKAAVLGSGKARTAPKNYCIFNLSFEIQEAGRLLISKDPQATSPVEISAKGFTPLGDGPTSAFVIDDSRVVFNGVKFTNFIDPALRAIDSDLELNSCEWEDNLQAAALEEGCGCILNNSSISLPIGGTGFVLDRSQLTLTNTAMVATSPSVNAFVVANNNSTLVLRKHQTTLDQGLTSSTVVALAKLGSVVICDQDFTTTGTAKLLLNSTLTKPVSNEPFIGGIQADSTSVVSKDQI